MLLGCAAGSSQPADSHLLWELLAPVMSPWVIVPASPRVSLRGFSQDSVLEDGPRGSNKQEGRNKASGQPILAS